MSQSAVRSTSSDRVRIHGSIGQLRAGQTLCQNDEIVPAGTGAIRAYVYPVTDHNGTTIVRVRSEANGAMLARGAARAERGEEPVAVPVRPVVRHDAPATVCVTSAGGPPFALGGEAVEGGRASIDGQAIEGSLRIVYLETRAQSWWSFLPTVVARMSAGERWSGAEAALLVLLLSLAAAALASVHLARRRT